MMIASSYSMYSIKTSYNLLSHTHWGLGQFVGGGGVESIEIPSGGSEKKESLQILDLQRLASLYRCVSF